MEIHGVCVCVWKTTLKQKSSRIEMKPAWMGKLRGSAPNFSVPSNDRAGHHASLPRQTALPGGDKFCDSCGLCWHVSMLVVMMMMIMMMMMCAFQTMMALMAMMHHNSQRTSRPEIHWIPLTLSNLQ